MTQEQMKVIGVVFAGVSLGSLALAIAGWLRPESVPARSGGQRSAWLGGTILFGVSLGLVAGLWLLSGSLGWPRDRVFWIGCGAFLVVMTLVRPWWFWDNYKARWLRELIGDDATAACYLILATIMMAVGLMTEWHFGRQ